MNRKKNVLLFLSLFIMPFVSFGQGKVTRQESNNSSSQAPSATQTANNSPTNNHRKAGVNHPIKISLATEINGQRRYFSTSEWKNLPIDERIMYNKIGILIRSGSEEFLLSLKPLPSWSNWETAKARSGNQMPTKRQWQIIKSNRRKVEDALTSFGGGSINQRRWWNRGENASWTVMFYDKASINNDDAGVWLATDNIEDGFKEVIVNKPVNKSYDYIGDIVQSNDSAWRIAKFNGKYGFVNNNDQIMVSLKYDDVYYGSDKTDGWAYWRRGELMSVCVNDKWGYINRNGETVIPLIYDELGLRVFDKWSHYSMVSKDGLYGIIDNSGKIIIPIKYSVIEDQYSSKNLIFAKYNNKYGFINKNGSTIIPYEFDFTAGFSKDVPLAAVGINGKYGFIDSIGQIQIPLVYDFAESFENGLAPVVRNNKVGFINQHGDIVIPFEYEASFSTYYYHSKFRFYRNSLLGYSFNWGRVAMVKKNGKYGMIDMAGNNKTPFKYDNIKRVYGDGLFTVSTKDVVMYLDKGGNEYSSEEERREKSDSILAYQGYPHEQYIMGKSAFIAKDYNKAYPWIKKSAEGGDVDGQYYLGRYYYYGYEPITTSYPNALQWFSLSADQGNNDACYFLGWMYEHGQGVSIDKTKALEWYKKSNGIRDSNERIAALSSDL